MPVEQKSVAVLTEVEALFHAVCTIQADIKSGKGAAAALTDAMPDLILVFTNLGSFSADVKAPEFADSVALGVAALVKQLTK